MAPQPVYQYPSTVPAPVSIALLKVRVVHQIRQLFNHLPGIAKGSLVYSDLNAYGWYTGSTGLVTLNRGRKGLRRTGRGIEDGLGKTSV